MKNLEASGKTVEEAVQHALEQLGVSREEVEVTVLKEGKGGLLGLGAEEARVSVMVLGPVSRENDQKDVAGMAKNVLETLLSRMGVSASIALQSRPPVEKGGEAIIPITLEIEGDDLGILIGRRGQTLACLQYIVRLIVAHQTKAWLPVSIDVAGYKQRHYEALQALALRMAEQVKARGTPFALEPMSPYERRIIHLALVDYPGVVTESTGEGEARKVVILPKKK